MEFSADTTQRANRIGNEVARDAFTMNDVSTLRLELPISVPTPD
jgi:hypothetical protein